MGLLLLILIPVVIATILIIAYNVTENEIFAILLGVFILFCAIMLFFPLMFALIVILAGG